MADIRPPLPTDDAFTPWANDVRNSVREKSIIRSKELEITSTPFGSYMGLRAEQASLQTFTRYKGEWNLTSSYNPHDMIRILPGKTYDYPWVAPPTRTLVNSSYYGMPAGTVFLSGMVQIGNVTYPLTTPYFVPIPGTYVCVAPIPDFNIMVQVATIINWGDAVFNVTADNAPLSGYSQNVQRLINYIRFANVNYFPVYPEMPDKALLDITNLSKLQGRYWDCLSLAPTKEFSCTNGQEVESFVDTQAVPSGSANYTGSL